MAGHDLIDSQLRVLARRLPGPVVEELADGLTETYQAQLQRLGDPQAAALEAVAEFGDADSICAAFVRQAPSRAAGRALPATGPIVGAMWAIALVNAQAWTWPMPSTAALGGGAALTQTVSYHYKAVRLAAVSGAFGMVLVDVTVLTTATVMALPSILIVCALTGSVARVVLTAQMLIRIADPHSGR
ncbi:hypothetical protein GT755_04920 [Herbidospora sp. NEAU-GS84]|uniref:DUF1700 domain-containing protein n=1 Tax=Herbidospora solisilvae TaxID=2696284 RepID=A0A7C9J6P6_9ACTN|nr:hypothetical protein [Herbidospora solisilvae]NAS21028.1 hypothetical protein [Herbidospora solisilvae]